MRQSKFLSGIDNLFIIPYTFSSKQIPFLYVITEERLTFLAASLVTSSASL